MQLDVCYGRRPDRGRRANPDKFGLENVERTACASGTRTFVVFVPSSDDDGDDSSFTSADSSGQNGSVFGFFNMEISWRRAGLSDLSH